MNYAELEEKPDSDGTGSAAVPRTNESYRNRIDKEHHCPKKHFNKKNRTWKEHQLERLPIDMTDCFTIDMMHCFCRGVMVRFFSFLNGRRTTMVTKTIDLSEWKNMGEAWDKVKF